MIVLVDDAAGIVSHDAGFFGDRLGAAAVHDPGIDIEHGIGHSQVTSLGYIEESTRRPAESRIRCRQAGALLVL